MPHLMVLDCLRKLPVDSEPTGETLSQQLSKTLCENLFTLTWQFTEQARDRIWPDL
jgi:hypothetical protein